MLITNSGVRLERTSSRFNETLYLKDLHENSNYFVREELETRNAQIACSLKMLNQGI